MRFFSRIDLKMLARLAVGSTPLTYGLLGLRPKRPGLASNREKMVNKTTDLCIDGFPHSGNTFFIRLVSHWNPDLKIARHMHVPVQIKKAVAAGIPTLVLIRSPEQALTSTLYRYPDLHSNAACAYYYRFYRPLLPIRDRFVTVDFNRMVHDPVFFLKEANLKFGCAIAFETFDEKVEQQVIRKVPRKVQKKKSPEEDQMRSLIRNRLTDTKGFKKSLRLYNQFVRIL